jgi:hypothetical protein
MDARAYLEKLVVDRLGAGKGQPAQGRRGSFSWLEIRGVAVGLVAAGVLEQQEAERILADLEATLQRAGWIRVVPHEVSTSGGVSVSARAVGAVRPEWSRAIEDPPTPVLRSVVPLAGRVITVGGVTTNLISLELWSTLIVLRLAYVGEVDVRRFRERVGSNVGWRAWDDVGTQYAGGGGGASGSHGRVFEEKTFQPGPPAEARVLTLLIEDGHDRLTVPIQLPVGASTASAESDEPDG